MAVPGRIAPRNGDHCPHSSQCPWGHSGSTMSSRRNPARVFRVSMILHVVPAMASTNRRVAVLLNYGQGNFRAFGPSAFPGAFTSSEKSCTSTTDEIKDATALPSRESRGNCSDSGKLSSPRNVTEVVAPWASVKFLFSAIVPFLGRAPPSFAHHI